MDKQAQAADAEERPVAVPRGPSWAVVGIFLLLLVAGLAYARAFMMPVVLAVLLTLVFGPVRRRLGRLGVAPGVAAFLIVGTLLCGGAVGVGSLAVPAADWIERAPTIGWEFRRKLYELRGATEGVRKAAEQLDKLTSGPETSTEETDVQRVRVEQDSNAFSMAMSVPGIIAQVVFTLVLLFFLLASGDMFYEKIVHVLPTFKDKRLAIRIAHDIERKLSRYLLTISTINAGLGIAVGFAMWWFEMPNPAIFGILAFLLNFVPYVGALFGVALSLVVGIVSLDSLGEAIVPAIAYFALTSCEGQFITPYFVGRSLQLNTVVVFLCVTFFAWLWSVVGMLVATPLLVAVRTFCEHIPALEGLGHFLSARGREAQDPADNGT
jgi:predicted PurR-regulated permease PerM